MTSSGKIRIYELSKDLSLDNKDVLDAARKLAIAAKSHSSSISSLEANQIKDFLKKGKSIKTTNKPSKKLDKIRVKPIVYDDVHIIVVNPHNNNYQIATVSKVINT